MRLLKPVWLHHDGHPIFSIDIHPDSSRVATGGQGNGGFGRVVIWNMQPILSEDGDSIRPKLLCQLDHHNGKYVKYDKTSQLHPLTIHWNCNIATCVNCVRWSTSGQYLCSGGDDRIIIIWMMVPRSTRNIPLQSPASTQNSSAFGTSSLEDWKQFSILRSHTGDILDVAWSPGDKYLASASVDNTVIVWDAHKFPKIVTVLKGHQSLVKGVTWDPVGKYLASQSDDRTLKVWRVEDWTLEKNIEDPFAECGATTHVLRSDWSPDGLYLVCAHAMNRGGPTAKIVERGEWTTTKDFVGHRKAVVCVRFNGNIIRNDESGKTHSCLAVGSRDKSVSIWSTILPRPLVVIKDLFTNSVMDLSWSSCGNVLMACSVDGSVAVAQFSSKEIGKSLTSQENENFFRKVYAKSVSSPTEGCEIVQNLQVYLTLDSRTLVSEREISENREMDGDQQLAKIPENKQIESSGRKRTVPNATPTKPITQKSSRSPKRIKPTPVGRGFDPALPLPVALKTKELQNQNIHGNQHNQYNLPSCHTGGVGQLQPSPPNNMNVEPSPHPLPPMKVNTTFELQVDRRFDSKYTLQVINRHKREDGLCHQLVCSHNTSSLNGLKWIICTDAPFCFVSGDVHRIIALCEDSTCHVLTAKGRYAFPPIVLAGFPSRCVQSGPYLVVVTTKATIHVWNIYKKQVVIQSETLEPLLNESYSDVARIQVSGEGQPIIIMNTGKTFMYSLELSAWFLVSDPRGLVSSPLIPGEGPSDKSKSVASRLLFGGNFKKKTEPAIISHMKLKLAVSIEMKNGDGIRQWLIALVKSLATHGREKELHQLLEDLLGPAHSAHSASKLCSTWDPMIAGLIDKRKLLRHILKLLVEDLKYQELFCEFDELLKEMEEANVEDKNRI